MLVITGLYSVVIILDIRQCCSKFFIMIDGPMWGYDEYQTFYSSLNSNNNNLLKSTLCIALLKTFFLFLAFVNINPYPAGTESD